MDQSFSATDFASTERFGNSGREKRGVTSAVGTRVSTPQASETTHDGTTCRSQCTVRKNRRTERTVSQRRASSDQHRHEKEGNARGVPSRRGDRRSRTDHRQRSPPAPVMEQLFRTASMTWQRKKHRYISTAVATPRNWCATNYTAIPDGR